VSGLNRTHGLTVLAGLAVGAAAGWLARPATTQQSTPAVPSNVPTVRTVLVAAPDCADESELIGEITDLAEQLDTLQLAVRLAQAQSEAEIGAPMEWPTNVDPAFSEAAIEVAIGTMAAEAGGTLVGLDCGEYPCVGVIAYPPNPEDSDEAWFWETLRASPYAAARTSGVAWFDHETEAITLRATTLALPAEEVSAGPNRDRLDFRMEDAMTTFGPDLEALKETSE